MPINVYYKNKDDSPCSIRPTPFIAVSTNILKNAEGTYGVTYTITLTGTLLAMHGTPYALNPATNERFDFFPPNPQREPFPKVGPYDAFERVVMSQNSNYKPPPQDISGGVPDSNGNLRYKPASALLSKQRAIRALFAEDGQRTELTDIIGDAGSTITCFPRVVSIDFTEGQYINKCEYTIVLEADYLLRGQFDSGADAADAIVDYIDQFANQDPAFRDTAGSKHLEDKTLQQFLEHEKTFLIQDYSEAWSLEADDTQAESVVNPRTYRVTHNLSATGKSTYYDPDITNKVNKTYPKGTPNTDEYQGSTTKVPAWVNAKKFVQSRLSMNPSGDYPNFAGQMGSGTMDLVKQYGGFNHVRTENIDVTAGTYSVTENWVLASGKAHESFTLSVSTSNSDPFVSVNIDGSIKGFQKFTNPSYSGELGKPDPIAESGAYKHALEKYMVLSNSGQFGIKSDIYKRANNTVAVCLNSQPVSTSLNMNQQNGEISYSLSFNNRPTNIISGVVAESIQVNDTYPGDVFAILPVLGRATGPILQYIGGRTEYKRDLSINLTMDYTKMPYGKTRNPLMLKKPSLVEPTATQIADLINQMSPQGEPGVRKYFVSPPSESWSPKEGTYSFNISWTYELDR